MDDLLALCLLKGFHCHCSQSFAPKISFRYEQDKWIIQLLFLESSLNPNELIVLKYLKSKIDKKFMGKDIILILNQDIIINVVLYTEDCYQKYLNATQYIEFNKYLENNHHYHIVSQKQVVFENERFYIAESTIPNAGFGLFASVEMHRNDFLLTFKGLKTNLEQFCKQYPTSCIHHEYAVTAETYDRKKYVFDPIDETNQFILANAVKEENFGPIINEPPENSYSNCESVSVSSSKVPLRVDLIATRYIAPHDEIFMLYNREPDKNYRIGETTPSPIELKFKTNHKKTNNLLCFGMNWFDNKDWFRLVHWHNNSPYSVFTVSDIPPPIEFQSFHFLPNDVKIKKNTLMFVNGWIDVMKLSKYFNQGLEYAILPFFRHHEKTQSLIYTEFLLKNTQLKFNIDFLTSNEFTFDSYESREFDNTYPLLRFTVKKSNLYTRFRDLWDEERVIKDLSLSDIQTVKWLKMYKRENLSLKKIPIPESKPLTLQYCLS